MLGPHLQKGDGVLRGAEATLMRLTDLRSPPLARISLINRNDGGKGKAARVHGESRRADWGRR